MERIHLHHTDASSKPTHHEVVVVGAGFSGLCIGTKLKAAGIHDFLILEKASQIGGTWRDNDYPGAACDIPGSLYSFSFMQNGAWSRIFPQRDELYAYTLRVASSFNLLHHIRLNTELLHGEYDEVNLQWQLHTSVGVITARALVLSVGPLSRPLVPNLQGVEAFHGPVFHSSRWDRGCDLTDKRIAVIGTGASAVQFIPEIARIASAVHIFQRTAPWVVPRGDRGIPPWKQKLLNWSSLARAVSRTTCFVDHEIRLLAFAKTPALMGHIQKRIERSIREQVPEALRTRVTPDYAMGCKRILLSDDYYPSLCRDNVEVIPEPATRFVANSIITSSGCERFVDVVIFATGFETDNLVGTIELRGRGGRSRRSQYRPGPQFHASNDRGGGNIYRESFESNSQPQPPGSRCTT
jgi:cation diffusion facilitator CzcD-associated flavoprotein CzcO